MAERAILRTILYFVMVISGGATINGRTEPERQIGVICFVLSLGSLAISARSEPLITSELTVEAKAK